MGALFLSSKLEESPLRIRDIINCFSYLESLVAYCSRPPYPPPSSYDAYAPMDYFATEFYDMKDALVIAEMQILKRLGFQTQCGLPYGHLVNYMQVLELAGGKELVRRCWGYCNDMCGSRPVFPFPSGCADTRIDAGCRPLRRHSTLKAPSLLRQSTSRPGFPPRPSRSLSNPFPGGHTSTRPKTSSSTFRRCSCGCTRIGGTIRWVEERPAPDRTAMQGLELRGGRMSGEGQSGYRSPSWV